MVTVIVCSVVRLRDVVYRKEWRNRSGKYSVGAERQSSVQANCQQKEQDFEI